MADGDARPVDQQIDDQRPSQHLANSPVEGDRLPLRPGERGPDESIAGAFLGGREDDELIIRIAAKLTAVGGEKEITEKIEKLLTLIMRQFFPAWSDHQFRNQGKMKIPANGGDKVPFPLCQRLAGLGEDALGLFGNREDRRFCAGAPVIRMDGRSPSEGQRA